MTEKPEKPIDPENYNSGPETQMAFTDNLKRLFSLPKEKVEEYEQHKPYSKPKRTQTAE
jgi:hypothetical protein